MDSGAALDDRFDDGPRWTTFAAEQVLGPGVGFIWKPFVDGRLIGFTGADVMRTDQRGIVAVALRAVAPNVKVPDGDPRRANSSRRIASRLRSSIDAQ